MDHTLKISVSKKPATGGIVSCHHISVRERFLRFLLGDKQRLTVIVPGDSVRELATITEFDDDLWFAVIENVVVGVDDKLTFRFKNGAEIVK